MEPSGTLLLLHNIFLCFADIEHIESLAGIKKGRQWILVRYREQVELNPGRKTNTESLLPVIQISPATVDMEEKLF